MYMWVGGCIGRSVGGCDGLYVNYVCVSVGVWMFDMSKRK